MTRSVPGIVVSLPEPAVSDGHPSVPVYWARFGATATLREGPLHIHAIADPNPVWNPATSGWYTPPPPISRPAGSGSGGDGAAGSAGDYRWSVDDLPDPGGGYYWLGDPSGNDGTLGIPGGQQQWAASPGPQAGPAWHSFFPYKPSVCAYDAYIPGERWIHHAKGVHCNSHYVEHMWIDLGGSSAQPFTWIVVATVVSDSFPGYQHHILDAGRNPDEVGFPRLSADGPSYGRQIGDNLPYRTALIATSDDASIATRSGDAPLRVRRAPGHHPAMFVTICNGQSSKVSVYDAMGQYNSRGAVSIGPAYSHRYAVFGREQGWISQSHASNILVFEIRYWHHALSTADLAGQYAQLSSTYQFDAYRRL